MIIYTAKTAYVRIKRERETKEFEEKKRNAFVEIVECI